MDRIEQAKREVRLNNWQRMYEEYLASGKTVRQWCADNNITPKTYYYRLQKLREDALKQEHHEIVPVRDSVEETKAPTANAGVIRITGLGITAKLPQDISPELLTALLKEPVIHADETVLRVLKRNGKQVDGQFRCWVFCSGKDSKRKMVMYLYYPTRSAKVVEEVLGKYAGYLQTDGYAAYNAAVNATRLGCWSHARRKWVECLPKGIEDKNSKAAQALVDFR